MNPVLLVIIVLCALVAWFNYYRASLQDSSLSPALMDLPTIWRNPRLRLQVFGPSALGAVCVGIQIILLVNRSQA